MAEGSADACVCVLFYGADEHCFRLAQRVLNEPMRRLGQENVEFRFGCNAVSDATRAFVRAQMAAFFPGALFVDSSTNTHKYPMMRRLFYSDPVTSPITIWFDDDSCFAPDTDPAKWLPRVKKQLESHAMLGSIYRTRLTGNQAGWIKAQPWYNGKEPEPYVKHASGSWWAIQSAVLQKFDWPTVGLKQRGVDVMLGELCRQNNLAVCHFRDGVWINANETGLEFAGSKRGPQESPIGFEYQL